MLLLALLAWLPLAGAGEGLPQDVQRFMQQRDLCDHLRGEAESEDAVEAANRACKGTDQRLHCLKAKYRDQPQVLSRLQGYEERVEAR